MANPIELYLIRHGLAAARGDAYPDDSKRPLTNKGISRLKSEVRALVALDVTFDQILTSPLVRARQTADVFAEHLPSHPPVANAASLAPGGKYAAVLDDLAKHSRKSRIALVGHEPDMGELAAKLIGARRAIEFKKGAICRIDFEALPPAGPGHLRWFLTPRMLRNLAG
jgi:phosphohistidine phosphatase